MVGETIRVSIQLMSPASGDNHEITKQDRFHIFCFHSINVPSEWGPTNRTNRRHKGKDVSIQLMSPASGDTFNEGVMMISYTCFHSINVPSEWGLIGAKAGREHGLMFPFN